MIAAPIPASRLGERRLSTNTTAAVAADAQTRVRSTSSSDCVRWSDQRAERTVQQTTDQSPSTTTRSSTPRRGRSRSRSPHSAVQPKARPDQPRQDGPRAN
jgi:hypothetical protein